MGDAPVEARARREPLLRRLAMAAVLLAVVARLGALAVLDMDPLRVHHVARGGGLEWDWGYEQASVAQAIARGDGFADPFPYPTGPTAWAAPAYPLILGGLIHLFGGITPGVAWCMAALQILCASLTCWFLFRLGRGLHSPELGLGAAFLWALHPLAIYWPVQLVWDSTLVAMAITWLLASLVEQGDRPGGRSLALLGVGLGLTLLVNPAPLALAPLIVWRYVRADPGVGGLRRAAVVLAVGALVAAPWWGRNAVVLGTPQIRSNLGVEVFVGNNDGARGPFNGRIHPAYHEAEKARFLELGEVAYARDAMQRGLEWIERHPGRFGRLTLERFQRFWFGPDPTQGIVLGTGYEQRRDWMGWIKWLAHAAVGLFALAGLVTWRGRPGSAAVVGGVLLLFPLVYYVTHVFERYRFPIEPVATLLTASFLLRLALGARRMESLR